MDMHISPTGDIPIDDLIKKHKADQAIQQEYGVKFKSMWVNKEKGIVFCLMEGPDKCACSAVHQEAHGDTGCNIIEVSPGEFSRFFKNSFINANDIVETEHGAMDTAYRTLLRFEVIDPLCQSERVVKEAERLIKYNHGALLLDPLPATLAAFTYPSDAFRAVSRIRDIIDAEADDYRLVVISGKPVEKCEDSFFGYVKDLSHKMSVSSRKPLVRTTQLTVDLLKKELENSKEWLKDLEVLSLQEERYLSSLMEIIQENIGEPDLTASALATRLGLSRSQLFKKTKKITGLSPNALIREVRLCEALRLLGKNKGQIAQVAFDTGFNTPSYFSKMFSGRFGILPSGYTDLLEQ